MEIMKENMLKRLYGTPQGIFDLEKNGQIENRKMYMKNDRPD